MRIIYFLILLISLLILPLTLAATEECSRHGQLTKDIPCLVLSSYIPTGGCNGEVYIYDISGASVANSTWFDGGDKCKFYFNVSTPIGTYTFNSSIETGAITLEKEDTMLAIVIGSLVVIVFFVFLGFINQSLTMRILTFGMGLMQLILMVGLLYANELNYDLTTLLNVNFWIVLLLGFGFGITTLILHMASMMNLQNDEIARNNPYKKWVR